MVLILICENEYINSTMDHWGTLCCLNRAWFRTHQLEMRADQTTAKQVCYMTVNRHCTSVYHRHSLTQELSTRLRLINMATILNQVKVVLALVCGNLSQTLISNPKLSPVIWSRIAILHYGSLPRSCEELVAVWYMANSRTLNCFSRSYLNIFK